jgi:hypothetical protein
MENLLNSTLMLQICDEQIQVVKQKKIWPRLTRGIFSSAFNIITKFSTLAQYRRNVGNTNTVTSPLLPLRRQPGSNEPEICNYVLSLTFSPISSQKANGEAPLICNYSASQPRAPF